jgi:hypothetical protein
MSRTTQGNIRLIIVVGNGRVHARNCVTKHETIVRDSIFFALSANKVTTIDNQQWINVHVYVMQNWIHIPNFTDPRMNQGATIENIIAIFLQSIMKFGNLAVK